MATGRFRVLAKLRCVDRRGSYDKRNVYRLSKRQSVSLYFPMNENII